MIGLPAQPDAERVNDELARALHTEHRATPDPAFRAALRNRLLAVPTPVGPPPAGAPSVPLLPIAAVSIALVALGLFWAARGPSAPPEGPPVVAPVMAQPTSETRHAPAPMERRKLGPDLTSPDSVAVPNAQLLPRILSTAAAPASFTGAAPLPVSVPSVVDAPPHEGSVDEPEAPPTATAAVPDQPPTAPPTSTPEATSRPRTTATPVPPPPGRSGWG